MNGIRKVLSVALACAMLAGTAAFGEAAGHIGENIGSISVSATSSNVIPEGYTAIYTIDDLYSIRANPSGNYILMNDIDLSATAPGGEWDCGTGWAVIDSFSGILDGNDHKITNMNLYGNIQNAGFINVNTGTIKNLRFDDVVIDVSDNVRYGTVCSFEDKGKISCCGVSGSIKITARNGYTPYVGGIAGYIRRGSTISSSYNSAEISGGYFTGGICGCMYYESNAYNGDVIQDCYNTGSLSNATYMGGIVGYRYYYETVEKCCNFNNGAIFGISTNENSIYSGNGKELKNGLYCLSGYTFGNTGSGGKSESDYILYSEEQFKDQANLTKLDFTENGPWEMAPDGSRPQLKNIREITVTDIEITRMPPKTTYTVGETLIAVGEISVVCSNGNTGTAAITTDMLSGYDMNKVGKQNVTISYMGATADYEITVNPIKATNISLSENQVSINKAQPTKVLTATVLPENTTDKTVTWKSCNPTVATVSSNGTITAVNPGITTITASTENGLTAVCNITVYEIRKSGKIPETCTSDGVKEYYYTFVNAPVKYYKDSACRTEISNIETWKVIPAAGHSILITQENRKEATCTKPGSYEEVKTCSVCGEEINRTTRTIRATGHTAGPATQENRHEATCTQHGSYEEVKHCTVCGEEVSRVTKSIPATGHTTKTVQENRKEATCTTPGSYDEVTYCKTCDEELSRVTKAISATGHSPGETVIENRKAVTCTTSGSYDEVIYCSTCGEEISRKTTTISAIGHDWGEWTTSGTRQFRVCNNDSNHKEYRDIDVTSVKVSKTSVTVNEGKSVTITATVNPSNATDKTVTWTTSNSSVATVSNGEVTAVEAGTATITAKTSNGKTATCTVTVVESTVEVTDISLNKTSRTITKGSSDTLTATISPANATNKTVTWTTSDSAVATVDQKGKVTAVAEGTVIITAKTNNGKTATCNVSVKPMKSKFVWGEDNWNLNNWDDYFPGRTYRDQMNSEYLGKLASNLDNIDYNIVFVGSEGRRAWLDEEWGGSCYGMSATTFLSKEGLLPYSNYHSGATKLNQLNILQDADVRSLIDYYQMLQVKDVTYLQFINTPKRSNEENIKNILSLLDNNSTVMVGFRQELTGVGHEILAYGYEYGSWSKDGVTYGGRIKICDPNRSSNEYANYEDAYIYFNTNTFSWSIPMYNSNWLISSAKGAKINHICANINEINEGGYLSGTNNNGEYDYVARLDAYEISDNRSVTKVKMDGNGSYMNTASDPNEIEESYSYVMHGEDKGVIGYNLYDTQSAYKVTQYDPGDMKLSLKYKDCMLYGGSAAGKSAIFDNSGFVEINGESADYNIGIVSNSDYPTDWFAIQVSGSNADDASLEMTEEGYVLSANNLENIEIKTNNKESYASLKFDTTYDKVLIYEIDPTTIGLKVDTDNNGTFETVLDTEQALRLDKTEVSIGIGEKVTLKAITDSTTTVTWSSSDNAIATVTDGIVTGKKAGTATITAMTSGGVTATCTVTVVNLIDEVKGDINSDGTADIADALMAARYDAGLIDLLSETAQKAGDVTGDGIVNIADALKIARFDAQLITGL